MGRGISGYNSIILLRSVMYQAEYYHSLYSQGLISFQLILKSQGWEWLTVTLFPGICRLQELCGSLLATEVITYRARADVSIFKEKFVQLKSSYLLRDPSSCSLLSTAKISLRS